MRYFIIPLAVSASYLLSGCETMQRGSPAPVTQPQINTIRAESRENFRFYQEQTAMLKNKVNALQDKFSMTVEQVKDLQQKVQILNRQNHELDSRVAAMQSALEQEKRSRRESEQKIIDTVTDQIVKTVNAAAKAAPPTQSSRDDGGIPAGPGSFYKYEVQAGATLSAIARAAHVSVEEIKRANRLDSDIIRVGQILYIPKK